MPDLYFIHTINVETYCMHGHFSSFYNFKFKFKFK